MACENLNKANFHAQLAPENCHGRDLHSVDQCATAIRLERKDERRMEQKSNSGHGGLASYDWEKRSAESKILERQDKAGQRGGMTRRPEDGLINPPRGYFPETMRDTGSAAERLRVRDLHEK
jgi:hypothetical protein